MLLTRLCSIHAQIDVRTCSVAGCLMYALMYASAQYALVCWKSSYRTAERHAQATHIFEHCPYSCISDVQDCVASGALSALQLESVTYGMQRHAHQLPGGERAGFFIGDGAGVGKVRAYTTRVRQTLKPMGVQHIMCKREYKFALVCNGMRISTRASTHSCAE